MADSAIRIGHDDDIAEFIAKANKALEPHHLAFVDDGEPHDGYCVVNLVRLVQDPHVRWICAP
jgi:hypothetical protein